MLALYLRIVVFLSFFLRFNSILFAAKKQEAFKTEVCGSFVI
jgi:hypothetical protein